MTKLKLTVKDHSSITSAKKWVSGGGQMLMFADKVGGWGWPNADACQRYEKNFQGKNFPLSVQQNIELFWNFKFNSSDDLLSGKII